MNNNLLTFQVKVSNVVDGAYNLPKSGLPSRQKGFFTPLPKGESVLRKDTGSFFLAVVSSPTKSVDCLTYKNKKVSIMSLLSISDLNTTINHEPRVHDLKLAEALGMEQPRNIRQTIESNKVELEGYGGICTQLVQNGKRGRPSTEYWLNEGQAMLLCMFGRTERAGQVRKAIIDVFIAYRRETLTIKREVSIPQNTIDTLESIYSSLSDMGDKLDGFGAIDFNRDAAPWLARHLVNQVAEKCRMAKDAVANLTNPDLAAFAEKKGMA